MFFENFRVFSSEFFIYVIYVLFIDRILQNKLALTY